jgi:hypothetical protein
MTNKEYILSLKGKKLREGFIRQKTWSVDILRDGVVVGQTKAFDYILPDGQIFGMYHQALDEYLKWLEKEREDA